MKAGCAAALAADILKIVAVAFAFVTAVIGTKGDGKPGPLGVTGVVAPVKPNEEHAAVPAPALAFDAAPAAPGFAGELGPDARGVTGERAFALEGVGGKESRRPCGVSGSLAERGVVGDGRE
jgi:hypothetical protein